MDLIFVVAQFALDAAANPTIRTTQHYPGSGHCIRSGGIPTLAVRHESEGAEFFEQLAPGGEPTAALLHGALNRASAKHVEGLSGGPVYRLGNCRNTPQEFMLVFGMAVDRTA